MARRAEPDRFIVIHCPDWAVTALGYGAEDAAMAVNARGVVGATRCVQRAGVRVGMRRRAAQQRAPEAEVCAVDDIQAVRVFEAVARAVEAHVTALEVVEPGEIVCGARGPSRYYGGEQVCAEMLAQVVDDELAAQLIGVRQERGGGEAAQPRCGVGVADTVFAATLAARRQGLADAGRSQIKLIPANGAAAYLAPLPINLLGEPELTGVLTRLGLHTLGSFADLAELDVAARFGPVGRAAWRSASGLDTHEVQSRSASLDVVVARELDPPAQRVDEVAFVAKMAADELWGLLHEKALTCARVCVEAETEHGESLSRWWRHDGRLTPGALAERVRLQLESWVRSDVTSGGVTAIRLIPGDLRGDRGDQEGLWGERKPDERLQKAIARLQGLLGVDEVQLPLLAGGRHPQERSAAIAWGAVPDGLPAREQPWPGALRGPAPTVVLRPPQTADVLDAHGQRVGVNGRGLPTGVPCSILVDGRHLAIRAWAGPWPVEERWWDAKRTRRLARWHIVTVDERAFVVTLESGAWWIDGRFE